MFIVGKTLHEVLKEFNLYGDLTITNGQKIYFKILYFDTENKYNLFAWNGNDNLKLDGSIKVKAQIIKNALWIYFEIGEQTYDLCFQKRTMLDFKE